MNVHDVCVSGFRGFAVSFYDSVIRVSFGTTGA